MTDHDGRVYYAEDSPLVVAGSHVPGLFVEVDALPLEGETVLGRRFSEPEDGGKATNQAVAAAKLGAPVRVVTMVGNDERGRRWRRILAAYGLDTRFLIEATGPTDVGFVLLPPSRVPAIVSARDLSVGLDAQAVEGARDAFDGASLVLCQLEAPQSCAIASFRLARAVGARTILNAAPAQSLEPELLALTDLLVVNQHEAAALVGSAGHTTDLAARLATQLPDQVVVLTAGREGCFIVGDGPDVVQVQAETVDAIDTTGAGDAFVGALAARLRAGEDLDAAVRYGARAASLSVTRKGTMPAFATADEVRTWKPHVPAAPSEPVSGAAHEH